MMRQHPINFGTDGWRALLDSQINEASVAIVAQAFAEYCKINGHRVAVIGFDGRKHSDLFARIIANVLKANDINVFLSHAIVPTPVVSYHCARLSVPGVMVTASHNPHQYNGIKFKSPHGSPFYTEETTKVERLIGQSQVKIISANPETTDLLGPYMQRLETMFDFGLMHRAGFAVAIDAMHGAAANLLEQLFNKYDIPSASIAQKPLQDFGGRLAEPVEVNLKPLMDFVKQGQYGLGLATDGDADRLGVVDEMGNYVNIQEIILAFAQYVIHGRNNQGPLVKTASVTDKMLRLANHNQVIDVQVGFKYVAEAMLAHKAVFGAEESGGFGFGMNLPERDGIFSALMMTEMLARSQYSGLSSLLAAQKQRFGQFHYSRIDWHNNNPNRHRVLDHMLLYPPNHLAGLERKQMANYRNSHGIVNGIKMRFEGDERWLLVRVSETEPMIRIYAEGQSESEVKQLLNEGKELFENIQNQLEKS